eukprot:CAMPEP_0119365626 /NCGR_PEP_ID=MMETSP1334-20130426/12547_1 /TAXON_ID=127549 /ORGANISM="Calcidiscus leptoporus, Strain RCC1130" /LENGTH=104 /DNA_ID=CAMNT_0007381649 /DNA_START=363 /DNA_END=677 /DNA_ORIENTATION=-
MSCTEPYRLTLTSFTGDGCVLRAAAQCSSEANQETPYLSGLRAAASPDMHARPTRMQRALDKTEDGDVRGMRQGRGRDVTGVRQGRDRDVTGMRQGCDRDATET